MSTKNTQIESSIENSNQGSDELVPIDRFLSKEVLNEKSLVSTMRNSLRPVILDLTSKLACQILHKRGINNVKPKELAECILRNFRLGNATKLSSISFIIEGTALKGVEDYLDKVKQAETSTSTWDREKTYKELLHRARNLLQSQESAPSSVNPYPCHREFRRFLISIPDTRREEFLNRFNSDVGHNLHINFDESYRATPGGSYRVRAGVSIKRVGLRTPIDQLIGKELTVAISALNAIVQVVGEYEPKEYHGDNRILIEGKVISAENSGNNEPIFPGDVICFSRESIVASSIENSDFSIN